jgi:uncharacterized protein
MECAIIAYDGKDEGALERRLKVREKHMTLVEPLQAKGHLLHGGAILDEQGKMVGSIVICNFPSQAEFDDWFHNDPYVVENVWQEIRILPFKTASPFLHKGGSIIP